MKGFLAIAILTLVLSKVKPDLNFMHAHVNAQPNTEVRRDMILAEQSQHRVIIVDVNSKKTWWEWKASESNVRPEHWDWFRHPSDAKAVYNGKYILLTASGGGVALVRIEDRKTVFYAYAGGNTHSAELLPDGNIVSASSTGNFLCVFKTDTTVSPDQVLKKKIWLPDAHNVVWDAARNILWSAGENQVKTFRYNFNCTDPNLSVLDSTAITGRTAHDLFPIYNTDTLWLTNVNQVFKFPVQSRKPFTAEFSRQNIKSISSGPAGYPVIVVFPKESWWTDEVKDAEGHTVFKEAGLKIYKARWLLENHFSYPAKNSLSICNL